MARPLTDLEIRAAHYYQQAAESILHIEKDDMGPDRRHMLALSYSRMAATRLRRSRKEAAKAEPGPRP